MTTPDQVRAMVQGREELRMDDKLRGKPKPMDEAGFRACSIDLGNIPKARKAIAEHFREVDRAARQDERRKVLELVYGRLPSPSRENAISLVLEELEESDEDVSG